MSVAMWFAKMLLSRASVPLVLLGLMSWGLVNGQEQKPTPTQPKEKALPIVRGTKATITALDAKAGTVNLKTDKEEVKATIVTTGDKKTTLMKEGKDATLDKFAANETVFFGFQPRSKTQLRFLSDPASYIAFIRRPIVKGKVKSFDVSTLTLTLTLDGDKEKSVVLPGRGVCCFLGGKALGRKQMQLKAGDEVTVVMRTENRAIAVFDAASWKVYADHALAAWQKRIEAAKKRKEATHK